MSRCLSEHALLKLLAGDEATHRRAHLTHCLHCTARYQQLVRTLRAIEHTLATTVPPAPHIEDRPRMSVLWIPAVVVLTAALLVGWVSWWRPPSFISSTPPSAVQTEQIYQFLTTEVDPAVFAAADVGSPVLPTPASPASYLQAALDGGWPCEYREPFASSPCEPPSFALASAQD
ncbi:MAG TPA: hypothetical protein VNN62_13420 [Methylomirabilota bacterium]|jgi:hypothetical protein|nr:hypothetical protein [Methylomirabilota bacterium]